MDPITNPGAWDKFFLAGEPSPGLCVSVAGARNPRTWDEKKGAGSSGAGLVYQGDGLAKFLVRLRFWTKEHFDEWDAWKRLLQPPTEKNPNALDSEHPQLGLLPVPISSVVVDDPGAPEPEADDTWIVEIWFRQYRKPVPAQASPSGSKSGKGGAGGASGSGPGGRSTDPVDQYIDELVGEVNNLAGG